MPKIPKRKSIRLKNHDYSLTGRYFVTICTKNRDCIFGSIQPVTNPVGAPREAPDATRGSPVTYRMVTNVYGAIVEMVWKSLPQHHPVELDEFQVMPNHVHGIIRIAGRSRPNEGGSRPAPTAETTPAAETTPTLGTIVGLFKSECTKQIRRIEKNPKMVVWQRNYYEHVIRTEGDLIKIRGYLKTNPQIWHRDRNNPDLYGQTRVSAR